MNKRVWLLGIIFILSIAIATAYDYNDVIIDIANPAGATVWAGFTGGDRLSVIQTFNVSVDTTITGLNLSTWSGGTAGCLYNIGIKNYSGFILPNITDPWITNQTYSLTVGSNHIINLTAATVQQNDNLSVFIEATNCGVNQYIYIADDNAVDSYPTYGAQYQYYHNNGVTSIQAGSDDMAVEIMGYEYSEPPAGGGGIEINLTYPTNDYHTRNVSINFTFTAYNNNSADNMSCELLIDGVGYGVNSSIQTNQTNQIQNNATLSDGQYAWNINCSDATTNATATANFTIYIDTINPIVLDNLNGTTQNDGFIPLINFSDTYLYAVNFTLYDAWNNTIESWQVTNLTDTFYNLSQLTGVINTTRWVYDTIFYRGNVSDDHTAKTIPDYIVTPAQSRITFKTPDDNNIVIRTTDTSTITATKLDDRYSFTIDFADDLTTTRTFRVISDYPLNYRSFSDFQGHFSTSANWVDFEGCGEVVNITNIEWIEGDYSWDVVIDNVPDNCTFNSVGGLNIVNFNGSFTFDGEWSNYTITSYEATTYNQVNVFNISDGNGVESRTTTGTAYMVLNTTKNINLSISFNETYYINYTDDVNFPNNNDFNFTAYQVVVTLIGYNYSGGELLNNLTTNLTYNGSVWSYNSTNASLVFNLTNNLNYQFYVTSFPDYTRNHTTNTRNITFSGDNANLNFTLFRDQSFFATFKDIISLASLSGINITLSGAADYTYNLINSSTYQYGLTAGAYSMIAAKAGYSSFLESFGISEGGLTNISALMSSDADSVTIQVFNTDGAYVSGASVEITKQSDNSRVSIGTTDYSGQVKFSLSDLIDYYINVTATGYDEFYDTLSVIDNEYQVFLTYSISTPDIYNGISYEFAKLSTPLANDTLYNFTFNISSTDWEITGAWFYLYNDSNLLTTNTSFTDNESGWVVREFNTSKYTEIDAIAVIELNSTYNITIHKLYGVNNVYEGTYSLRTILRDISSFSGAGFGGFARFLIALVAIVGITMAVGASTQLLVSGDGERMLILVTALVGVFSYINWLNTPLIPSQIGSQYFIFVIMILLTISLIIYKEVNK